MRAHLDGRGDMADADLGNGSREFRLMTIDHGEQKTAQRVLAADDHEGRSHDRWKHVANRRVVMLRPVTEDKHEDPKADSKSRASREQHGLPQVTCASPEATAMRTRNSG